MDGSRVRKEKSADSNVSDSVWTELFISRHHFSSASFSFNTLLLFFFLFRRPWYHRALVNPSKAAVSNAYMDANGIGKVITISEAVFQALPKVTSNISCESLENLLGGCPCTRYGAYESLTCYLFCLTWSCVVTVQICYTLTHNLPFDRHAIS